MALITSAAKKCLFNYCTRTNANQLSSDLYESVSGNWAVL